jgi:GH15 family glucan-1,4-alpha-glucosidase
MKARHASRASAAAPSAIEDYALVGNTRTAALVSRNGSIDWWCVPRFDSPACFAALVGGRDHGRFRIGPVGAARTRRAYRDGTLVLETEFSVGRGVARLIDCMAMLPGRTDFVRIVEGVRGTVAMDVDLTIRFGYGAVVPWVRHEGRTLVAIGGPDTLELRTPVELHGEGFSTRGRFGVHAGQRIPFVLTHSASHEPRPVPLDAEAALAGTQEWWTRWSALCGYGGPDADAVRSSLRVLKALTYAPTGGIVAAPTTSLPERPGGVRNWDYRFCWLRDATFTLYALLLAGYREEAQAWREWLLRAAAGRPEDLQVLYGVAGERIRGEIELHWLPGYGGAAPVRIGNAAATQVQLDVYGEVIDALCVARSAGLANDDDAWAFQRALLDWLEGHWAEPDSGIWEMRGEPQRFTHSRVMAWVAVDRALRSATRFGRPGPLARWRALRARIHRDVCTHGFDRDLGVFVQRYGSSTLDASLLLLPIVGFLPATDLRVAATIDAIARELTVEGLVMRYRTDETPDGLPAGEGVFLPCSFWLAEAWCLQGRRREARRLFERLLDLRNDVGLLAEEYDPRNGRMLGNFPQALSHVALVNTARDLAAHGGPSEHRGGMREHPPQGQTRARNGHHDLHRRVSTRAPVKPADLDATAAQASGSIKARPLAASKRRAR